MDSVVPYTTQLGDTLANISTVFYGTVMHADQIASDNNLNALGPIYGPNDPLPEGLQLTLYDTVPMQGDMGTVTVSAPKISASVATPASRNTATTSNLALWIFGAFLAYVIYEAVTSE